jgi:hypothetical protein
MNVQKTENVELKGGVALEVEVKVTDGKCTHMQVAAARRPVARVPPPRAAAGARPLQHLPELQCSNTWPR